MLNGTATLDSAWRGRLASHKEQGLTAAVSRVSLIVASIVLCAAHAVADDAAPPYATYASRIKGIDQVSPLSGEMFGEKINLYDGSTQFSVVDIDLPGNSSLPVQLRRTLRIQSVPNETYIQPLGGLADWDIDIPYITATRDAAYAWPTAQCSAPTIPNVSSGYDSPDFYTGMTVHIPGEGDRELFSISAHAGSPARQFSGGAPWTTSNYDVFTCTSLANPATGFTGEGFVMKSPDGTQYTFNVGAMRYAGKLRNGAAGSPAISKSRVYYLVSEVRDRYGNTVTYSYLPNSVKGAYANGRLASIEANDGRLITLSPDTDTGRQAVAHGRTWTYAYVPFATTPSFVLSTVTLPDLVSTWAYSHIEDMRLAFEGWDGNTSCSEQAPEVTGTYGLEVTHPAGAKGTFSFGNMRHFRRGVPTNTCQNPGTPTERLAIPNYFDVLSLTSKSIQGAGLAQPYTWSYSYPSAAYGLENCAASACTPDVKIVTVSEPDQTSRDYHFGFVYTVNAGQLLKTVVKNSANVGVKTETHTYMTNAQAGGQTGFQPTIYGDTYNGDDPSSNKIRPLVSTVIEQDHATFTTQWPHTAFDDFARPTTEVTSSSVAPYSGASPPSRTDVTTYHDNTTQWIVGQVATVVSGGKTIVSNTYRPVYSDLQSVTRFGKLQYMLDYYGSADPARGALKSVMDGGGKVTTLGPAYKRGIPLLISYDTSPVEQESAEVSDFGELTKHWNASNDLTTFGYDNIGRLTSVTYPANDSVSWNNRTRQFDLLNTEYTHGLVGKRWKLTESTGQGRKETFFDALMRPVVTRTFVNGGSPQNLSVELRRFDSDNRTTFQSYPESTDLSVVMQPLPGGVHSSYDALGRVSSTTASSELGGLVTSTQYGSSLEPFVQVVTSPKLQTTRTRFHVMGSPDEAKPSQVQAPEGATTRIERDIFAKPLSIVRSGVWAGAPLSVTRSYIYDEHERLCRTDQPEIGKTIVDYDLSGNVAWAASSLNFKGQGCQRAAVASSEKVSYEYDGRNRLLKTKFDGQDKIVRTLTPDGAVASITSDGTEWQYDYNKRGLIESEILTIDGAHTFGLTWSYDANGNLSGLQYPDSEQVAFNPTALGKPTTVGPYATGVTTHPNGAFYTFTYGNGIAHTMIPNERGLPEFSIDAGVLNDGYTYDANGNVSRIDDNRPSGNTTRVMAYDDLDRLVSANAAGLWGSATYSYDALDNMRTAVVGTRSHVHGINSTSNQLGSLQNGYGTTLIGYSYDLRGNVSQRGEDLFVFDKINRLRQATGKGDYRYDGWGRRAVIDETDGALRYQVYSQAGQLLHELDGVTEKTTNYMFLGASMVARKEIEIRDVPDPPVLSVSPVTQPNTSGVYTISWTSIGEAVRYVLKERTNGSTPVEAFNGSGNSQPFGGKPSGSYTYTVQACSGTAPETCGMPSAPLTVSVLINPICVPSAPVDNTNVNPDADGTYRLAWTCSGGDPSTIKYTLEESTTGTGGWAQVVAGLEESFRDITDRPTGTYYYRVKACLRKSVDVCGDWSPIGSESVSVSSPPPTPTGFHATVDNLVGEIELEWNPNGSATYKLEEQVGSNWVPRQNSAATSLTITGRSTGWYNFRVRACNASANCGAPTSVLAVRVEIENAPATPQTPTIAPETCNPWPYCTSTTGNYAVTWTSVSGATYYKLFEDPPGATGPTPVNTGANTSQSYTGKANGEYVYQVQACNNAGCSASSFGKRIEVEKPPGLVTGLSATPTTSTNGAYTLTWNAVTDATSYVLGESVDAGGNPILLPAVTTTSKAFTGKANGTYRYYVKACAYETCGAWNTTPVYVQVNQAGAPATPTGLHGPPPPLEGPVDFTIAWNAVSGAAGYKIEEIRSCNPNPVIRTSSTADYLVGWGNCSPAGTGQTLTFNFRVKACNASDECSPFSPQIQLTFTVEGGGVERPQPITTKFYLHTDALGSIVAETNADKEEVKRNNYEPYGGPSIETSYTDGPGYTGHVTDAKTGLIYMQQRYYDALAGRFLSNDPVAALDEGGGFNRYWYAKNNPYAYVDPDGRYEESAYGFGTALGMSGNQEQMRVWAAGEAAATTMGSGAETGAALGEAVANFATTGDYSSAAVLKVVATASIAVASRGRIKGTTLANLGGMLTSAAKGKGNFGIGMATTSQANAMGKAWVGKGYNVASDGKTLLSKDGMRQFRPPSEKNSEHAVTGVQANFERRESPRGEWQHNAHLDIKD